MNRREFVKALASIPFLRLLVKPIWERLLVKEFVSRAKPVWGGKLIFWDPYFGKGNDANDGHSSETPVASLQTAIDMAESKKGDMIISFYPHEEL